MKEFNNASNHTPKEVFIPELSEYKEGEENGKIPELSNGDELPLNVIKNDIAETTPLSEKSKDKLREIGWPEEIIEAISSEEEMQIYLDADVKPVLVNDRWCLIKDINLEKKDDLGRTNLERMEQRLSPLDKNGKPIELHHIGQKSDAPLVELTRKEHTGGGNDKILHPYKSTKASEIDRIKQWPKEREGHWKARAEQIKQNNPIQE